MKIDMSNATPFEEWCVAHTVVELPEEVINEAQGIFDLRLTLNGHEVDPGAILHRLYTSYRAEVELSVKEEVIRQVVDNLLSEG